MTCPIPNRYHASTSVGTDCTIVTCTLPNTPVCPEEVRCRTMAVITARVVAVLSGVVPCASIDRHTRSRWFRFGRNSFLKHRWRLPGNIVRVRPQRFVHFWTLSKPDGVASPSYFVDRTLWLGRFPVRSGFWNIRSIGTTDVINNARQKVSGVWSFGFTDVSNRPCRCAGKQWSLQTLFNVYFLCEFVGSHRFTRFVNCLTKKSHSDLETQTIKLYRCVRGTKKNHGFRHRYILNLM